jgi:hypothetical protein
LRFRFGEKRLIATHVLALSAANIRFADVLRPALHLTIEQQKETVKAIQGGADLLSASVSICPEGWGTDEDS